MRGWYDGEKKKRREATSKFQACHKMMHAGHKIYKKDWNSAVKSHCLNLDNVYTIISSVFRIMCNGVKSAPPSFSGCLRQTYDEAWAFANRYTYPFTPFGLHV